MSKRVIAHCQRCHKEMRMTRAEKQQKKIMDLAILCDDCYYHFTNLLFGRIMNVLQRRSEHENTTDTE